MEVKFGSGKWLGAAGQQVITRFNVEQDLCRHMVSRGHNVLMQWGLHKIVADLHKSILNEFPWNGICILLIEFVLQFVSGIKGPSPYKDAVLPVKGSPC